jgi:hypothetical protein
MHSIIEPTKKDEICHELTAISQRASGLTPKTVLQVAKNPKSVLHKYFVWDDTEAARKYREIQAYALIRSVRVDTITHDKREVSVRAFFPVKAIDKDGTYSPEPASYMPLGEILKNNDATAQLIARAKSELKSFQVKYSRLSDIAEFQTIFREINRIQ